MEFRNVPHLLIVAPNWLGDAVMALPAIADVVGAASGTRISVAARPPIAPLFPMVPGVQDVLIVDGQARGGRRPADDIRQGGYAAALLLPNSFRAALTLWQAGVPARWGYRTAYRGPLLTEAVALPAGRVHQAAYYQFLVRSLGCPNGPIAPRLEATPDARRAGADLLRAAGWDERAPLVALAPGAAYGGAKRWPASSFADLAARLASDGVASVLVGGSADAEAGEEVIRARNLPGLINLIGRTDLLSLAGVLVHCRALVSNDSGAMHFGAALGVSVVALFGPTDERVTRPLGRPGASGAVVITHDIWCRPCLLRECPLRHGCMRGISVDTVAAHTRRSLEA